MNVALTDSLGISSLYPHNRYSICGDGSFSYASQTRCLELLPQRPPGMAVGLVCPPGSFSLRVPRGESQLPGVGSVAL